MASDYEGKTVIQLKEMCRKNGLPVSGTKKVLINRLKEADRSLTPPPQIISDAVQKRKKPSRFSASNAQLFFVYLQTTRG